MSSDQTKTKLDSSFILNQPLPHFEEPDLGTRKLLIVDDDLLILRALERLLKGLSDVELIICSDPHEAIRIIDTQRIAVLISDQIMPQMNGLELLRYTNLTSPSTISIMLTGERDMDLAVKAINNSEVFRFITKPWKNDHLIEMIRLALSQHQLNVSREHYQSFIQTQNQRLQSINEELESRVVKRTQELEESRSKIRHLYQELEGSFDGTLGLMLSIMALGDPVIVDHCSRTTERVRHFAQHLDLSDDMRTQLVRASMLHWIGLVNAPRDMLNKPREQFNSEELAAWEFHPLLGQQILQSIPSLRIVAEIILNYTRPFRQNKDTGSEFFGGQVEALSAEVTRCCFILNICSSYEWERTWQSRRPTINLRRIYEISSQRLRMASGEIYQPTLVEKFCAFLDSKSAERREEVTLYSLMELKEGMVLSRAIETPAGLPMVAAETTITHELIERLIFFEDTYDEWFEQIFVWA